MEEFSLENDLYLEIADFSKKDGYIRYPVYNSKYYKDYNDEDIIPFSTYYLEALRLNIQFVEENERELTDFDSFVEKCEIAFYFCNTQNRNDINEYIKEYSDKIRNIVLDCEKDDDGIYVNGRFKFGDEFQKINEDYDAWALKNKKIVDGFKKKNGTCVAIAMPLDKTLLDSENCYLALSGLQKDYAGSFISSPDWKIDPVIQNAYTAINSLLYFIYKVKFKECHFIDDTRRYTYYDNRVSFSRSTTDGRPLRNPVKFTTDYKKYSSNKNFNAHYSCCEKKILAHMGFVNTDYFKLILGQKVINKLTAYEFRIKFEPCKMCRPALIGCYHIKSDMFNFLKFSTSFIELHKKFNPAFPPKEPLIVLYTY